MGERGLDPALPSLERLLDDAEVRRAAVAAGAVEPVAGALIRRTTAWDPGEGCLATFAVPAGGDHTGRASGDVLCVHATPSGWCYATAADDPALPGLREVLAGGVRVVSYKPGASCVVEIGADRFGKVVPRREVAVLRAAFDALGRIAALDDATPTVPEVHDVDHRLGLLVMARVAGRPLRDVVRTSPPDAMVACAALGAALGAMHRHRRTALPPCNPAADDGEVRRCLPAARAAAPAEADRLEGLLDRASARAGTDLGPIGPAHGALRTDQVVVTAGRPALVDLDGACAAPAERDVANLAAYLWWRGLRAPSEAHTLAALVDTAMRAWRTVPDAAPLDVDRLRTWRALSLLKIAGRRYRNLTIAEWPLVPRLLDEAAACL